MSKIDSESMRDTRRKKSAIFALEGPSSFPSFPCIPRATEPPRCVRPMIACVPRSLASSHRQDLASLQSQADVVLAAPSLELTVDLSVPRKGMQLRSFREQAMLMIVLAEKVFPSTVSYVMKLRHRRLWTVYKCDTSRGRMRRQLPPRPIPWYVSRFSCTTRRRSIPWCSSRFPFVEMIRRYVL